MKSNKTIKNVVVKFNKPLEVKKPTPVRRKFVTGVSISEEGRSKLKRVFSLVNRARHLAIRYLTDSPDIGLDEFKSKVFDVLTSEQVPHFTSSIINRELYHIHKLGAKDVLEIAPESKSISFHEEKMVNNRFTINYRRDKIVLEDLDILLDLENRLPRFDQSKQYYLNVCVNDLLKVSYVFVNLFYYPEQDK